MSILTSPMRSVRPVLPDLGETSWQAQLRLAVRTAGDLCRRLDLAEELASSAAAQDFPVFVPPSYLARIRPGDPSDPLLRQVLPIAAEGNAPSGFSVDPVGDGTAALHPGVLRKYAGRALLIATGACAVHCRYCFRRHFPYEQAPHSEVAWDAALAVLHQDSTLAEVILSGGDPLMLVDERLSALIEKIAQIPHVFRLRIHTRLPIVIPERITERLLALLTTTRLKPVVVVHVNHARELAADVTVAFSKLREAGVMLLNQAVLLRGVNDSTAAQRALSESLFQVGVLPYYLHQLDRVQGAAHFEVPIEEGRRIVNELREQLPGYLVPRYVQEITGEPSKTILM